MGAELSTRARDCAGFVVDAVQGRWPAEEPVHACLEAMLAAVGDVSDDAWLLAWAPVAAEIADAFGGQPGTWSDAVRFTNLWLGRVETVQPHPRHVPGMRMGQGASARYLVRLPLAQQVATALLKGASGEERLAFIEGLEDTDVFTAVLGGMVDWGPDRREVVELGVRVWERFERDLMRSAFLEPFRGWAAARPGEARALVEAWLGRMDEAHRLPPPVAQHMVEGVAWAGETEWEAWRDRVAGSLGRSRDERRQELAPRIACSAWPAPMPDPTVRHRRMLALIEAQDTALAVLSGLGAMEREAASPVAARASLATTRALIESPHASAMAGQEQEVLHHRVAVVLLKALHHLPLELYEEARPDIEALLGAVVEMKVTPARNMLDGMLLSLAERDRARAEDFLRAWLERHGREVAQSATTLQRWFPVGFGELVGKDRSAAGWCLRLMEGPSLPLRAFGGQSISAMTGSWGLTLADWAWLRSLGEQRLHGLCHEIAAHVPRSSAWAGFLFELAYRVPSTLGFVTAFVCSDVVLEWPLACRDGLSVWQRVDEGTSEDHRQALVNACHEVSAALQPLLRLFEPGFRHPSELVSMTPASDTWWRQEQRQMALAMRAAEGQSIWRQFAQEVPILRGDRVMMTDGQETKMESFGVTKESPMRARIDPATSWMRRMWHSSRAAELLRAQEQET